MSLAICYFLCCIASVARSNAKWCLWCQTSGGVGPEEHAFPWFALSHAGAPLLWPGGASVATFAAELLTGPMWGGREGGPGCPSGQPGKKTAQVKTTTQRYFSKDSMLNHSTCNRFFFLCNSLDGLPGGALGPHAGSAGSLRWERKCVWVPSSSTYTMNSIENKHPHRIHAWLDVCRLSGQCVAAAPNKLRNPGNESNRALRTSASLYVDQNLEAEQSRNRTKPSQ